MHGRMSAVKILMLGYALGILLVFGGLCLPFSQGPDRSGEPLSAMDHLFLATSAVSTTGLITVDPASSYSFVGELILLIGFQLGGLGHMLMGSFLIMSSHGHPSVARVGKAMFSLPEDFRTFHFIRHVVVFTLLVEGAGAVVFFLAFSGAGVEAPLWAAVFHAVSGFCTVGLSLFPDSLASFQGNPVVVLTMTALNLLGAIGFIVMNDVYTSLRKKDLHMTLTSRVILVATAGGLLLGTFLLLFEPTFAKLPFGTRLEAAFFHTVSAITTTGFTTFSTSALGSAAVICVLVLMVLGASPSGTGGGLKSTTWSAAIATAHSVIRGRKEVTFFGRTVPESRLRAAFASVTLYFLFFAVGVYTLSLSGRHTTQDLAFEVASALSTVGLSRGITGNLNTWETLALVLLMYVGRLGVISFSLAALSHVPHPVENENEAEEESEPKGEEDLAID